MKVLFLAVLVSILGYGCANSILRGTANVIEIRCDGSWTQDYLCTGKIKAASRLAFEINPITKSVLLIVEESSGDWYITSNIYKDCAIVDSDNWECGSTEKIGVLGGRYRRHSEGSFSYDVRGVSGWRYWAVRFGQSKLAFLDMSKSA